MAFVRSGLLSACVFACVCACADLLGAARGAVASAKDSYFGWPQTLNPVLHIWGKFVLAALAIISEEALPLSKLPPLPQHLRSAGNEGAKGLPLYVDTPRLKLHVSPSMAVPC